jgi:hypothetical protein
VHPWRRATAPDETIPSAFDGQYITKPKPGPGNEAVEWWWFQALAPEVNGIIPSVEAIFYEGSFIKEIASHHSFSPANTITDV